MLNINKKEKNNVIEELRKPLNVSNETQYKIAVYKRLQDILGLNFDLVAKAQVLENRFLVLVTITLRYDDGTTVSTREGISIDAELEKAKQNAFLEAASLLGIPKYQKVTTMNCSNEKKTLQQKRKGLISVEIASSWNKLGNGQIYCGVWGNSTDKKKGTKSVLVLGERAQNKIVQAGYNLQKVIEAYIPGEIFCCYAESRKTDDGITEYVMQDIHVREKKGE